MDAETDKPKECCLLLKFLEERCVSQQAVIDTLSQEVSFLQERFIAQETMLKEAIGYIAELEKRF
jgi:hypothetical protein